MHMNPARVILGKNRPAKQISKVVAVVPVVVAVEVSNTIRKMTVWEVNNTFLYRIHFYFPSHDQCYIRLGYVI